MEVVPDDFSYLDPDRLQVAYERDMSAEQRERFADAMAATKKRASESSIQPPYGINLLDGRRITLADMREPSDAAE